MIKEKLEKLREKLVECQQEIEEIQNSCPHNQYKIGLFSWREGSYDLMRICNECSIPLGNPNGNEIDDYNNEMELIKLKSNKDSIGQGSKIYTLKKD